MAFTFAVAGKGGSGKTSVATLIIRHLTEAHRGPVLAVDADPNFTLGRLLGVEVRSTVADIREDLVEKRVAISPGESKDRAVEYLVEQTLVEAKGFDVLTMGRPEGPHCYCYANHLLRTYLDRISSRYPFIVIDNEAGMEHLSRRTTNNVEALILVAWANAVSLRAAARVALLAEELPVKIKRKFLLLNGVRAGSGEPNIFSIAGVDTMGTVPFDEGLDGIVSSERSLFELSRDSSAFSAVRVAMDAVLERFRLEAASR